MLRSKAIQILVQLSIPLLMLQLTRYCFLVMNHSHFPTITLGDHFVGLWFDLVTVALFFFPFYLVQGLPIIQKIEANKWYRRLLKWFFMIVTGIFILANFIDCAYFPYTEQRSTLQVISDVSNTGETGSQLSNYLSQYWWLMLVFWGLVYCTHWLYDRTLKIDQGKIDKLQQWALYLVLILGLFVIARGGFRPKPIGVVDAARYVDSDKCAYVLNTPFTMLKRIAVPGVETKHFISIEEEKKLFNPIRKSQAANLLPDKTNVMIIVLESFGIEFVGSYSGLETYTPFLDSLADESMMFVHSFANGKKSTEALPAIIASIPSLTDDPYMDSPYGTNKIEALPRILIKEGYTSSFFHGASNGSMRFDAFAKIAGFERYYGRTEYGNDADFDGSWGIWDHAFNPWVAKQLSKQKQPFCSMLFTVSSHHPYKTPAGFKIKQGEQAVSGAINYADQSLKIFFEEARKQAWFNNTLFVIVADHSSASQTTLYNSRTHMYRIPLLFYDPGGRLPKDKWHKVAQQLDIYPTILDLINVKTDYYAFGSSLLQNTDKLAITRLSGTTYLFQKDHMISFNEEKAQKLLNFTLNGKAGTDQRDIHPDRVLEGEKLIQAILQRYYRDVTTNKLRIER